MRKKLISKADIAKAWTGPASNNCWNKISPID